MREVGTTISPQNIKAKQNKTNQKSNVNIEATTCEPCYTHVFWLTNTQASLCNTHSQSHEIQIDHSKIYIYTYIHNLHIYTYIYTTKKHLLAHTLYIYIYIYIFKVW